MRDFLARLKDLERRTVIMDFDLRRMQRDISRQKAGNRLAWIAGANVSSLLEPNHQEPGHPGFVGPWPWEWPGPWPGPGPWPPYNPDEEVVVVVPPTETATVRFRTYACTQSTLLQGTQLNIYIGSFDPEDFIDAVNTDEDGYASFTGNVGTEYWVRALTIPVMFFEVELIFTMVSNPADILIRMVPLYPGRCLADGLCGGRYVHPTYRIVAHSDNNTFSDIDIFFESQLFSWTHESFGIVCDLSEIPTAPYIEWKAGIGTPEYTAYQVEVQCFPFQVTAYFNGPELISVYGAFPVVMTLTLDDAPQ